MPQCHQCGTLDKKLYKKGEYNWYCKSCLKGLENPLRIEINGRKITQTTGICSCCGFSTNFDGKDGLYIWQANFIDSDGVFYARLCGDLKGSGCVYDIENVHESVSEMITDTLGDDTDFLEHENLGRYLDGQ